MRRNVLVALAILLSAQTAAVAQSDVIMRRTLPSKVQNRATPTPTPTPVFPTSYYSWQTTAWDQAGSTCGEQTTETRTVTCVRTDGTAVADAYCIGNGSGSKPVATDTVINTQACTYAWQAGAWDEGTNKCGVSSLSRDVTCVRSDDKVADDASCSGHARPASSSTVTDYSGCGFAWAPGVWSPVSTTCGSATQTRTVDCRRTDGTTVPDASCINAGTKPPTSQSTTQTSGCTSYWSTGAWGSTVPACGSSVQNRTVTCMNGAGTVLPEDQCTGTKPDASRTMNDYSTCGTAWRTGDWSAPATTCGDASETRTVTCVDDSGATVDAVRCTQTKPPSTRTTHVTTGCTTDWLAGDYGPVQPACGTSVQVRGVTCHRSDGQTVANSACDAATQPTSTQPATDYSACTFAWTSGPWSDPSTTCGQATSTRIVTCQRADGTDVDDGQCSGTRPATSQPSYETSGCTHQWLASNWTVTPGCGDTSETRALSCRRSDGQSVDDGQCADLADKPATTGTVTDYSACTFDWAVGDYGAPSTTCGTATQTRSVACQRSDGTPASEAQCTKTKPDATQTQVQTAGCSYTWQATDWKTTPGCGATTQTRTAYCQRSDSTTVDDALCDPAKKPVVSQATTDYGTCTYSWYVTDWSQAGLCGQSATQTRTVKCLRSSASTDYVDDALCTGGPAGAKPASSQTVTDYSGCTYAGTYGAFGACTSPDGNPANGTMSGSIQSCKRSDGATVDNSYCASQGPSTKCAVGAVNYCTTMTANKAPSTYNSQVNVDGVIPNTVPVSQYPQYAEALCNKAIYDHNLHGAYNCYWDFKLYNPAHVYMWKASSLVSMGSNSQYGAGTCSAAP